MIILINHDHVNILPDHPVSMVSPIQRNLGRIFRLARMLFDDGDIHEVVLVDETATDIEFICKIHFADVFLIVTVSEEVVDCFYGLIFL